MPKRSPLSQIRATLCKLTLDQARELQRELGELIEELEQQATPKEPSSRKGREVLQVEHIDDRIYQLELVRCGKAGCKCMGENGELHGPYWYAYQRENGKLKSRYIGKKLDLEK